MTLGKIAMTFGGTSFTNFAGAMGRTFMGSRGTQEISDTDFDKYERAPALRADIEAMLAENLDDDDISTEEAIEVIKLRASEKREHDTMCQIRGALYPAD